MGTKEMSMGKVGSCAPEVDERITSMKSQESLTYLNRDYSNLNLTNKKIF